MPILGAAPASGPAPFAVEAVVHEEDRWLVLSAPPIVPELSEHPIRLHTAVAEAEPRPLGRVVVRAGSPLGLLAVVHDLDREPTVTLADVRDALADVVAVCKARGLARVALPLLGLRHGRGLVREDVLRAIAEALSGAQHVSAVWLVTDDPADLVALQAAWPR